MNVVNFSDGIDGLAAGVCAISGVAFSIIAFDLDRGHAGVLAALTAGAAAGFLVFNLPPARVYMGDAGSNLLGLLLGCVAVEGAVKTQAVLALLFPLVVLAVPFLDTTFVVLKRMKYRRPVYGADANHFHHRFSRIGFSAKRTVLWLYGWTACLAAFAVALRFVPYSDARRPRPAVVGGHGRHRPASSWPPASTSSTCSRSSSSSGWTPCACAARARARPRPRSTPTSSSAWRPASSRRSLEAPHEPRLRGQMPDGAPECGYPHRTAPTALIRSAATPSRPRKEGSDEMKTRLRHRTTRPAVGSMPAAFAVRPLAPAS